jgi:fructokinase
MSAINFRLLKAKGLSPLTDQRALHKRFDSFFSSSLSSLFPADATTIRAARPRRKLASNSYNRSGHGRAYGASAHGKFSMSESTCIGIDFGGTKIEAAALDARGEFLCRMRVPNPGNYDAALAAVSDLVARVESQVGRAQRIGMGVPGSISPRSGVMRNANTTWLNGRNLRADVMAALGREVKLANDANCLALSEVVDGAARDSKIAVAVILGTGCGGGLVVDGRLVAGAHGIAGELGHTSLPWPRGTELDAPQCWCGQRGCIELWVSGSGLQRDFEAVNGVRMGAPAIIDSARAGNSVAIDALDRYVDRLGRTLAMVCNLVDPDTIVLGGGLSNVAELYARLPQTIREFVFSDTWEGRIVPAHWGDSSGVRGAARLL